MRSHAKGVVAVSAVLLSTLVLGAGSAAAEPPTVSLDPPADVSYLTAKVSGEVDPKDANSAWSFEYSSDGGDSWSGFNFDGFLDAGTGLQAVSRELTGLTPGTEYQLRLVAWNFSDPQVFSAVESFETAEVAQPTISFDPISAITGNGAQLSGNVDPNDPEPLDPDPAFDSSCRFEYLTDAAYQPIDEKQRLTIRASGGTYTLSLGSEQTSPIAHDAPAATVQSALEGLANVEPGDVSVSGGPGNLGGTNPYVVTFAGSNPPQLVASSSGLIGPGKAQVTTIAAGYFGNDEVQRITIAAAAGTFTVTYEGSTSAPIAAAAEASAVQSALEAMASIGPGNVTVLGNDETPAGTSPYRLTFTGALGEANVKQVTVNASGLAAGGEGEVQTTSQGHSEGFEGATLLPCDIDPVSGSVQDVEAELTNLEPNTTYHVRMRAENAGGVAFAEQTFTTATLGPAAAPHFVGGLTSTSARLVGFVDPQNEPTTYFFEWGTEPDLSDAQSLPASAGSSGEEQTVFEDLSGLAPDTGYYFRVIADNPTGPPTVSETRSFRTFPAPRQGSGVGAYGDRVIERVSAFEKNGNPITVGGLALDGNKAIYSVFGGATASIWGERSAFISRRTPSGWVATAAEPPRETIAEDGVYLFGVSDDLSALVFRGNPTLASQGNNSLYRYDTETGAVTPQATVDGSIRTPTGYAGIAGEVTPLSADLRRAVGTPGAILPEDPSEYGGLYDYSKPQPQLIGLLPGEIVPACGVDNSSIGEFAHAFNSLHTQHWISEDGARVFFHSRGNDCSDPSQLYMREGGGSGEGSTTWISGPTVSGPPAKALFIQATPDGEQVFFQTASRLDPGDINETEDIYRHTLGEGNDCITCLVSAAGLPAVDFQRQHRVVVSQDGSTVVFASSRVLGPGAQTGGFNLYVWRAEVPEALRFVGRVNGLDEFATSGSGTNAVLSADGETLIFTSSGPGLDRLTGTENGGFPQFYRLSMADGSLSCVSCLPEGETSGPVDGKGSMSIDGLGLKRAAFLTDDGSTFAFTTAQPLDELDSNGVADAYEWRAGEVGRVTVGAGQDSRGTMVFGLTPDGGSILFKSPLRLAADTQVDDQALYVARIGGGFPSVPPPEPCAGDGCQGPPSAPPPAGNAGSASFGGPGDIKQGQKPRCAKGKTRKKGRCVKKQSRQKRSSAKRGARK